MDFRGEAVNKITDNIYVGPFPNLWVRRKLRKAGVTHIINARRQAYTLKNIIMLHNPMKDEPPGPKEFNYWYKSIEFTRQALMEGGTIYIHCKAGINRGPGHCYAALRGLGHSQTDSWSMVKNGRSKARPRYVETIEKVLSCH